MKTSDAERLRIKAINEIVTRSIRYREQVEDWRNAATEEQWAWFRGGSWKGKNPPPQPTIPLPPTLKETP